MFYYPANRQYAITFGLFSSPEPKAHWSAYSIVVEPASVRRRRRPSSSTFSNDFSSEAARPNLLIFHI